MVTAFEITINNESKIVAGISGISVLSLILTYKKIVGEEDKEANNADLRVGGLLGSRKDYEHLDWIERSLKIGDEIFIRVVETSNLTKPISQRREDSKLLENARWEYYQSLKKEYEQVEEDSSSAD